MEIKTITDKVGKFVKKYQYIFLIIVIGFILLLIPSRRSKKEAAPETVQSREAERTELECKLSDLLSRISGAGKVEVLLTYQTGEERFYQTDRTSSNTQDTSNNQSDTVIISDSGHNQTGLLQKVLSPTYRGAIIVCEGADDPSVQLAIVEAVSNVTGLASNRISVLKMK